MSTFPRLSQKTLVCLLSAITTILFLGPAQSSVAATAGPLTAAPSTLYFGNVIKGQVRHISCTVTNTGSASATISKVKSNNPSFTVTTPRLPDILAAGAKAAFTVTFSPTALAHKDASIVVTSNASNPSFSLPVHGTGVQAGTLRAAPASIGFGSVQVGDTVAKSVSVTNVGFSNVTISSDAVSGFPFGVSGLTLPATLTPSESITFKAKFAPGAGGARSGSLTLHSSATNASLAIALSGTAIPPGTLSATPATVYFGSTTTGADSNRSATLHATGGRVIISSATVSNTQFTLTGAAFPLKIPSGQSATLALTFAPQNIGLATASLKFKTNAVKAAPAVALQGHGVESQHHVTLSWSASKSAAGYNIYRGTKSGGPYSKLNPSLDSGTSYSDASVAAGDTYYYVTTAVGSDGLESGYSSQVGVTIPNP